jgi:hypothetical protein
MACTAQQEEWTVHMINDRTHEDITIIFCLEFDNGEVSGSVFDEFGEPFPEDNSVKGLRVPTTQPPRGFMSLDFRWDKFEVGIRILMVGRIFVDEDELTKYDARFIAVPAPIGSVARSGKLLASPDVGDTGTGTGQQT